MTLNEPLAKNRRQKTRQELQKLLQLLGSAALGLGPLAPPVTWQKNQAIKPDPVSISAGQFEGIPCNTQAIPNTALAMSAPFLKGMDTEFLSLVPGLLEPEKLQLPLERAFWNHPFIGQLCWGALKSREERTVLAKQESVPRAMNYSEIPSTLPQNPVQTRAMLEIRENSFPTRAVQPGTAGQGSGVSPCWRDLEPCGCGTWGCGTVVTLAGLGERLDSRILEGFSSPNNARIQFALDSLTSQMRLSHRETSGSDCTKK